MKQHAKTRLSATLGALSLFLGSPALAADTRQEKDDIKQAIINMVNAVDSKQWHTAKRQFAPQVYADYSSLTGQPGANIQADILVDNWASMLGKVNTHHQLSNFAIELKGDRAQAFSHVYASHSAPGVTGYWDVFGQYQHQLEKRDGQWKIHSITLDTRGQKGNLNFFQDLARASEKTMQITTQSVEFNSQGNRIVGTLYYPSQLDISQQYPAIIVSGSWTTVKEQMAGLYADKLARQGYIALAFDFSNFGQSQGVPRFYENPGSKVRDISNAVTYLQSLSYVAQERVGALGICAGSMYTLMAAADDKRIKSVVTVASWLHDAEAVKLFYGGEQGVQARIAAAQRAKANYAQSGEVEYIPSISTTDPSAAMYGPYDYYLNPKRGALPQWSADKFAVMSWEDWLTLDPMPSAAKLTAPTLMVHSDGAVLPQYTRQYFANIATKDKKLHWMDTELESPYHQFNFYDQPLEVNESIAQAKDWFDSKL